MLVLFTNGREGSFSETSLPPNNVLGNWVSASDLSRKLKSGLLEARMQSKPNTRANNRVIDEARFEVADALLKEKNSANLSGRRLVALVLQVPF